MTGPARRVRGRGRRREDAAEAAGVRGSAKRDARYEQLVELAPDAILIHEAGRIVLVNTAALRLAGATRREQLVGQPVDAFLNPPYLKAVEARLLSSDGEVVPTTRDTFRRVDGATTEVEVSAIAFMDQGLPSVHLVVRDVTDRLALQHTLERTEERFQQAQKLESIGSLAGGVAHEVNNMMTAVLGFSEFMLKDPGLTEERRADARQISDAAGRAATVTRQLLSFSRRAYHNPRIIRLDTVIINVESIVRRLLNDGQTLVVTLAASPSVWGDGDQLTQVIVNMALNARDAMAGGGTLTLSTEEITVQEGRVACDAAVIPAGRYGALRLRDTGDGMDRATQARIFEPFFTTKPVGRGTGLGLAAAYGIMKQHKGHITVASVPGDGTEFALLLPTLNSAKALTPLGAAGSLDAEPPSGPSAKPAGATVLVVEDEPAVRTIASRILERGGFRVLHAQDAAGALEIIDLHGAPDLVLTDVMMPRMTGSELARQLRERFPALPVLFMSGFSADELRRQGARGVGAGLIQKPFNSDSLIKVINATLAGRVVG